MNCRVSADFPTPPLPTMMTLWTIGCVGAFLVAIFFCAIDWPPPPPPPLLLLVREAKTLPLLLLLLNCNFGTDCLTLVHKWRKDFAGDDLWRLEDGWRGSCPLLSSSSSSWIVFLLGEFFLLCPAAAAPAAAAAGQLKVKTFGRFRSDVCGCCCCCCCWRCWLAAAVAVRFASRSRLRWITCTQKTRIELGHCDTEWRTESQWSLTLTRISYFRSRNISDRNPRQVLP